MSYTTTVYGDIAGVEVEFDVEYSYYPGRPMAITGTGFGDAIAPEPEEWEITSCKLGDTEIPLSDELTNAIIRSIEEEAREYCA